MRLLRLVPALLMLGLAACGEPSTPAAAVAEPVPPLATAVVAVKRLPRELRLDGVVEALQQSTVSAQTHARVVELPVDVGDVVEQGQVIARLRDVDARARSGGAQAALAAARAQLTEAELSYQRTRDVWERKLIARAQFDRAEAQYKAAAAQVAAAEAAAREAGEGLDYTVLRAPYAGIVLQRHVEVGEVATIGTPLLTGVSLAHLRVAVDVPEQAIAAVRRERQARVLLTDGRWLPASALRIPPGANSQTHSFRVLVELPEAVAGLFPGTLLKVAFASGETQAVVVPVTALARRGEVSGVYVLDADGRLSLRYLQLGSATAEGEVAVLSGLSAGEKLALDPVRAAQAYAAQRARAPGKA